jgi:hypothetical protein
MMPPQAILVRKLARYYTLSPHRFVSKPVTLRRKPKEPTSDNDRTKVRARSGHRRHRCKFPEFGKGRGIILLVPDERDELIVRSHEVDHGGMVHDIVAVIG